MAQKKALVAMSGGVDSSVAAYLTKNSGYICKCATLRMWGDSSDSINDARHVATSLGMEFHVFDAETPFRSCVIDSFICAYETGLTPNPCMECNRYMKFGFLLDKALEMGCDLVVTGHYARIRHDENTGRYLLFKAADKAKDQTYFLS